MENDNEMKMDNTLENADDKIVKENIDNPGNKEEYIKVGESEQVNSKKKTGLNFEKDWFKILSSIFLIAILITALSIKFGQGTTQTQKWEYKTITLYASESNDRTGDEALNYNTIEISESKLNQLGEEGWELVSSDIEMETAYPNFGNSEYVTGIQPNVRPQCVKLLFKRPFNTNTSNQS